MYISATKIKITSIIGLIRFLKIVGKVTEQIKPVDGLEFIELKGFSTLTGWKSLEAMKAFRNHGPHKEAMKMAGKIGKTKSVSWEAESKPSWTTAKQKLSEIQF